MPRFEKNGRLFALISPQKRKGGTQLQLEVDEDWISGGQRVPDFSTVQQLLGPFGGSARRPVGDARVLGVRVGGESWCECVAQHDWPPPVRAGAREREAPAAPDPRPTDAGRGKPAQRVARRQDARGRPTPPPCPQREAPQGRTQRGGSGGGDRRDCPH